MHILIAPNAFKNSLDAASVASFLQQGLQQSRKTCTCECFPVGDGGDGTGDLIVQQLGGAFITAEAEDPLGRKIIAKYGLIQKGKTAVIELANASGIRLLKREELDPLHASTRGTGQLIKQALDKEVKRIMVAIGGSATVDAGTGILQALGIRFLDVDGKELKDMPESLVHLTTIDFSFLDPRIRDVELLLLCDVENYLLGEQGAAAVFGPQKGADSKEVEQLELALTTFRNVILMQTGKDAAQLPHGGAAGGVAAGLQTLLNAKLVNGIDYYLELTGFEKALQKADLVITGEGSIDLQTLEGKGPFGVAKRAKEKGIPVIAVAGKVPLQVPDALQQYFDVLLPIGNEPVDMSIALKNTPDNLQRTGKLIGDMLALSSSTKGAV